MFEGSESAITFSNPTFKNGLLGHDPLNHFHKLAGMNTIQRLKSLKINELGPIYKSNLKHHFCNNISDKNLNTDPKFQ